MFLYWKIFNHHWFQRHREKGAVKERFKGCFPRMVYTEWVRKLHSSFNQKHTNVSLSLFFRYESYYLVRTMEKEKLSCLCINYLNPLLLLQSINIFRKSKGLPSHYSLTGYIDLLQKGESFEEANDKFDQYQRVIESYVGKEGKPVEYQKNCCHRCH